MDILGAKVQSASLGSGIITEQSETMVIVDFDGVRKKFLYPSVFETFLSAEDPAIAAAIHSEIASEKEACLRSRRAERRRMMLVVEQQRAAARRTGKTK